VARAGHVRAGDTAPDFELETIDKSAKVRLASFRGREPVVLIFGSYT
jgi:peroxiredoxin